MQKNYQLTLGPLTVTEITQSTVALMGNKGTGKTNTLKMCAYTLGKTYSDLGVCVFDPLNVIRINGFDRFIVTKKGVDKGAKTAELLNKNNNAKVIFSFIDTVQDEQNTFVNSLFTNWKPSNSVICIDEIHDFCPQSGENYCTDVERAIRHWRSANDGFIFTSQRPAKVNKNVFELADILNLYRTVGNNDRKAEERILEGFMGKSEVAAIMNDIQRLGFLESYLINFRGSPTAGSKVVNALDKVSPRDNKIPKSLRTSSYIGTKNTEKFHEISGKVLEFEVNNTPNAR